MMDDVEILHGLCRLVVARFNCSGPELGVAALEWVVVQKFRFNMPPGKSSSQKVKLVSAYPEYDSHKVCCSIVQGQLE
jgi:hypothetical protein